jgi:hypothetical protein
MHDTVYCFALVYTKVPCDENLQLGSLLKAGQGKLLFLTASCGAKRLLPLALCHCSAESAENVTYFIEKLCEAFGPTFYTNGGFIADLGPAILSAIAALPDARIVHCVLHREVLPGYYMWCLFCVVRLVMFADIYCSACLC